MPKQTVQEKKAALQAQLAEIEAEEKKEQDAKFKAIGRTVFQEMDKDPSFKERVTEMLAQNLKNNADRALLGLEKLPSKRGRPSSASPPTVNERHG